MDMCAEYRRRAAECKRLAEEAITEHHRQAILRIAASWRIPRMDMRAEYRRRAAECKRLAEEAITEHHRQAILRIAASWRELADERERLPLTTKPSEPTA